MDQETRNKFAEVKRNVAQVQGELDDIKNNHLSEIPDIWDALSTIWGNMQELRKDFWRIMGGGAAIIAIVLTILQCFG